MKEVWKPIIGFDGVYEVSNLGNVVSNNYNRTGKRRLLKPSHNSWGYKEVQLSKGGRVKHFTIHRLVATHFLPNKNDLPEINHIDENKDNNSVFNLEWCNRSHNINHGTRNQRTVDGESIMVLCVEENTYYKSASEASRVLGLSRTAINNCLRGRSKTSGGYHWRYADDI